jgi:hypothetical protein
MSLTEKEVCDICRKGLSDEDLDNVCSSCPLEPIEEIRERCEARNSDGGASGNSY